MPSARAFGLLGILTLAWFGPGDRRAAAAEGLPLAEARAALYAKYRQDLSALADACRQAHCDTLATRIRSWLPKRRGEQQVLFLLDPQRPAGAVAAEDSAAARKLVDRFARLRSEQAVALWALAKRAAAGGEPAMACELVTETAREDHDFKLAWRFLGYVNYEGQWRTPFEVKQLGAGKVWHDKFGWLPAGDVARYEQGQRFYRNRWMPADEEARRRSDIRDGWTIETDHYRLTTNHSLEEGVALARRLEGLYAVWRQLFAGFVFDPADLSRRLAAGEPVRGGSPPRHQVVYFRTREEYVAALSKEQPQIGMTMGVYFDRSRTAYFFADDLQEPSTVYHEGTHQLFQESRPVAENVGAENNFWIVEAIACYLESAEERADYIVLGKPDAGRLPAARQRLLRDDFYVPLEELVSLGMHALQARPDLAKLYSQSAGLATFLMARYPVATVRYLDSVYAGRADQDTLAHCTGHSYAELDQEYRSFLGELDALATPVKP